MMCDLASAIKNVEKVPGEGLSEEMMFEPRPERQEGASQENLGEPSRQKKPLRQKP